ncbi:uL30 family ribosomal protein [Candidatus Woesearchaeota archaeon]|nr:uL30 family ribosomal protein [Candidatus Woesearchaeota archaeon]
MAQQKQNNKQSSKKEAKESSESADAVKFTEQDQLVVAVRIRGLVRVPGHIKDTLQMLNLHKKNFCCVYKDTPSIRGMLQKVKDYITFGTIDYALYTQIVEKRAEKDVKKNCMKKFFRLHPPRKGYGRKGVKVPFANSGALGDRKNEMKDLLIRML